MTHKEMQEFEQKLLARGYKRWNSALYGTEDYDVSKMVCEHYGGEDMYQIIYKFWDWSKYPQAVEEGSIDVVILPCFDGRADLELSNFGNNKILDIDWIENIANEFYYFITTRVK